MRCILTVNLSPWSHAGGVQRSTHALASALARRGHEVHVVYTKPPWEPVTPPATLPYRVVWAALPARRSRTGALLRPLSAWFVARTVDRLLREAGPSIVHGSGEEAGLVPGLRAQPGLPRFGFVMTPRYASLPALFARGRALQTRWSHALAALCYPGYALLGRALRGADLVCPTSQFSAGLFARAYGLPEAEARVIGDGVSGEFLAPHRALEARAVPAHTQVPFAIYFGQLTRERGVHTILDALAQAGPAPDMFVFAGRGPQLEPLREHARELGLAQRVRFMTWLDARSLADLLQKASFAVLPPMAAGSTSTIAEAMALGVPVISTTVGSVPELVEHDKTGVLVPPSRAPALAMAFRGLANDAGRRRELGLAAQAHVRAGSSWDTIAQRYEAVYADALARR